MRPAKAVAACAPARPGSDAKPRPSGRAAGVAQIRCAGAAHWIALILALLATCARPVRAETPAPTVPPSAPPAGEWKTSLDTQNGRSTMVVDIGRAGSRWVGQFDLEGFPIVDYPVEVRVAGDSVGLEFSAIRLMFRGTLSEDGHRMTGVLGPADSVVFERVGAARFSDRFLEMEAAAEDSTAVLPLSTDAHELRAAFNRDTAQVRVLLLLSPT